jgi:hypothetical protein
MTGVWDFLNSEDLLRSVLNPLIHILIILAIAYFLPRKRSKSMYWVSVVIILLEVVRKISGTGILIWLKQGGFGSEATDPTLLMISLAVLYSSIFLVVSVIILQKDVRAYLSNVVAK